MPNAASSEWFIITDETRNIYTEQHLMTYIDTHIHLDGEEFDADRDETVSRAREAGCAAMFVPAIDMEHLPALTEICSRYPGYAYPMIGLHPEEVRPDWREVLASMKRMIKPSSPFIAIGEVGLDFYWSREFENEQLAAFEEQVRWSVETRLPLMIHCRKAQNELVAILRRYRKELPGGVFHCFTGNSHEAAELLAFDNFMLGIGGVLTFKKSNLPSVLLSAVPPDRIVLETDAPYMAPVPMRGERNESAFITHIIDVLAACYNVSTEEIMRQTNNNVNAVFNIKR